MFQSIEVTAAGTALILDPGVPGLSGSIGGGRLVAAAANATAQLFDESGKILADFAAPANSADEFMPSKPVVFTQRVYLTLAGAGAKFVLYW